MADNKENEGMNSESVVDPAGGEGRRQTTKHVH